MKKVISLLCVLIMLVAFVPNVSVDAAYTKMWFEYEFTHVTQDGILYSNETMLASGVKKFYDFSGTKAVLYEDGSLVMWGKDRNIIPTNEEAKIPTYIMGNVADFQIVNGSCGVLLNDGTLWLWGNNEVGELGLDGAKKYSYPVKVMDNVKKFDFGNNCTGILTNDGVLYFSGILFDYTAFNSNTGKNESWRVGSTSGGFKQLASNIKDMDFNQDERFYAKTHHAVVTDSGGLWMIGENDLGQLAQPPGLVEQYTSFTKVMDGVEKVRVYEGSTAVVKTDGTLYAWGEIFETDVPVLCAEGVAALGESGYNEFGFYYRNGTYCICKSEMNYTNREYSAKIHEKYKNLKLPFDAYKGPVKILCNGVQCASSNLISIENGEIIAPVNEIAMAMGATVVWYEEYKTLSLTKGETILNIATNASEYWINGVRYETDVPLRFVGDTLAMSVEQMADAFHYSVEYTAEKNTLELTYSPYKIETLASAQLPNGEEFCYMTQYGDNVYYSAYGAIYELNMITGINTRLMELVDNKFRYNGDWYRIVNLKDVYYDQQRQSVCIRAYVNSEEFMEATVAIDVFSEQIIDVVYWAGNIVTVDKKGNLIDTYARIYGYGEYPQMETVGDIQRVFNVVPNSDGNLIFLCNNGVYEYKYKGKPTCLIGTQSNPLGYYGKTCYIFAEDSLILTENYETGTIISWESVEVEDSTPFKIENITDELFIASNGNIVFYDMQAQAFRMITVK